MKWLLGLVLSALVASGLSGVARADDADVKAVIDKAIKALGGEDKLSKAVAMTWKTKGTFTFNGNTNDVTVRASVQGLDHYRTELEGTFNGNPAKFITVLSGEKGWRKFGDNVMPMDESGVVNEKRRVYMQVIPTTLVALKGKDFKVESAGEETVGGATAAVLKVVGPDGKDFSLSFDKQSGLPVRQKAHVVGFNNMEFDLESTFADYKDFGGIKKATKIETKRDGEKFADAEVTEFSVADNLPSETFAEPQ